LKRSRFWAALATAVLVVAGLAGAAFSLSASADKRDGSDKSLKHVFVIMLENHSKNSVIGDPAAPTITSLANTYGVASQYFGVTHPSEPNYVASISGSNWFVNDDNPNNRFDHTNLVDQLQSAGKTWGAYMESMPSVGYLGNNYPDAAALPPNGAQLYVSKHNPFVLFADIRNDPSRLANVKPYTMLQHDLDHHAPSFVFISPNQCHDMHGGVGAVNPPSDGTPCPFSDAPGDAKDQSLKAKADAFVGQTVSMIMHSKAWTGNSVIFLVSDENDFTGNAATDGWESAAGCCDSPLLPNGYQFLNSAGTPDGKVWSCPFGANPACTYGGGLVPAIVIAREGRRHYTSTVPYNHYSMLRTIEENWNLGYLENASDDTQVHSMSEFLAKH
jgi:phosphatidylinositol-3-phosphatase